MAIGDEVRNPMDVPAGQRTPMEYLQQLFGKPFGGPPESTWEENPTATFLAGPTAGVGPGGIDKPDISFLTGTENIGQRENNLPSSLLPAATPPTAPTRTGPGPASLTSPAAPSPDQENMAMLRKLGASGLLPADFWTKHPDLAGGVMKVEQGTPEQIAARKAQGLPDISNKLYSFLEPNRKTQIEQTMSGVINQIGDLITKSLTGPNPTGVIPELGATLAALTNTAQTVSKTPAEIGNLNAQAAVHTATALEGPAKIEHLKAMATYYGIKPDQHGANIGTMATSILTHDMTEAAKIDADPLLNPAQKKEIHASREERTRNALNAVTTLMNKPTPGAPMTESQFRRQAQAGGYMPDQIQRELTILIQQGKVIKG